MVLVNLATRLGWTVRRKTVSPADVPEDDTLAIIPIDRRPSAGKLTVKSDAIESFTLHLALVGVAVLIGYLIKQGLAQIDRIEAVQRMLTEAYRQVHKGVDAGGPKKFFSTIPEFPLCMIGGLLVQIWEQKFDRNKILDLGLVRRIQNSALDFLVTAAIATISLSVIKAGLTPLLLLIAAGIVWNVFCVLVLARFLLPDAWFERSIAEMGQSMGVTATGLLLLRVVDPDYKSPAADAFATKQLMHEPIMGGGLWTTFAIPLLAMWGGWKVWLLCTAVMTFWIVLLVVLRVLRGRRAAAAT
jgi:ESS family glutamate:Na+ symporter